MPTPLTVKRPKVPSQPKQLVVGTLILGPLLGLWFVWRNNLDIHFEHPWLNLGVHAALIAIPLSWAFLISSPRLQFEQTEEEFLGNSTFLDKLPTNWWMMFLMWPAPIFAVLNLSQLFFTQYLAYPEDLSTTPLRALAIMAVTFAVGFFYATILMGNSEPQTLVSRAGLRTGLLRFFEWEKIHHLSQQGDLYSIYHHVNPALPAASFKLRDRESQATLERYISAHHVPVFNDMHTSFTHIKVGVILGFLLNLLLAFWLRFNTPLSALWIVLVSFGIGIVLTLMLERIRGVSKYSKYMPIIEGPAEGGINEHFSSPP